MEPSPFAFQNIQISPYFPEETKIFSHRSPDRRHSAHNHRAGDEESPRRDGPAEQTSLVAADVLLSALVQ